MDKKELRKLSKNEFFFSSFHSIVLKIDKKWNEVTFFMR